MGHREGSQPTASAAAAVVIALPTEAVEQQQTSSSRVSLLHHSTDGVRDFTAGSLGGIACAYVGHPFDTVKVRMQTSPHGTFKGPLECLVQTVKQGGFRGLYAGVTPSCAANIVENSILFMMYGYCQRFVEWVVQQDQLDLFPKACCGGLAACFSTLGLTPTELVKCRLQVQMQQSKPTVIPPEHLYKGPVDCAVKIVRTEGVNGLFRGMSSTLLREVPGNFALFGGYELSRRLLTPPGKTVDDLSSARLMLAGALGGVCLWSSVYPFDVIKSRVQVSSGESLKVMEVVRTIYRAHGIRGFYNGLTPCVARAFPANAALFYTVENSKVLFDKLVWGHSSTSSSSQ